MYAGHNRYRVAIQKPTSTQNQYGEPVVSWTTDSKPWAKIEPLQDVTRGGEYYFAKQLHSNISHRVTIRYQTLSASTAISPLCRIRWGTRYLKILSAVNTGELNRELVMQCAEDTNG